MNAKAILIVGMLALSFLMAGCAGGGASTGKQVEMKGSQFVPKNVEVKKGTTVTWVNRDNMEHTVTPLNVTAEFPDSGTMTAGKTFKVTFNTLGEFKYRCRPHSSANPMGNVEMWGTIKVTA